MIDLLLTLIDGVLSGNPAALILFGMMVMPPLLILTAPITVPLALLQSFFSK